MNENEMEARQFVMVLWMIWNNRNNCVWNGEKESGQIIGIKAFVVWNEWQ
jgi:hypothetical protein